MLEQLIKPEPQLHSPFSFLSAPAVVILRDGTEPLGVKLDSEQARQDKSLIIHFLTCAMD